MGRQARSWVSGERELVNSASLCVPLLRLNRQKVPTRIVRDEVDCDIYQGLVDLELVIQ